MPATSKSKARNKAAAKTMARVTNAKKIYGEGDTQVTALAGVSVEFHEGEFVAIMGPSGSGKSTLLHCAAGLDNLTSGEAEIGGVQLKKIKDKRLTTLRRDKVGFIFQSFNLLPTLNAEENIVLPLSIAGRKPNKTWFDEIVEVLKLRDRLTHTPSEMSGGQQQRVAVARALISKPDVIFADEPSGNLDSKSGAELLGFLRKAADKYKQAIVMVTHDPKAAAYADRVIFLDDGKIVDELTKPTTEKILDRIKQLGN